MSDVLLRIKRTVLAGRVVFTRKAKDEMEVDRLTELDVVEAIVGAPAIAKKIRSRSNMRASSIEYLYVIQGVTLDGVLVYTKGKLLREAGEDHFYVLISSKRSE